MWDQISDLHACHREVSVEIQLLKLSEETGEAAEAFIGMHGLNSRKGVCRSRDGLPAELADVIITAAVAMTGVTTPRTPGQHPGRGHHQETRRSTQATRPDGRNVRPKREHGPHRNVKTSRWS
jgi:hypothetical protein